MFTSGICTAFQILEYGETLSLTPGQADFPCRILNVRLRFRA